MRISDWSSDVCSSDLPRDYPLAEGAGEVGDLFTWPAVVEDRNITGYHSIAVPGHVAGMGLAWERYGSMPWAEPLAPAIALAQGGLPVTWCAPPRLAGAAKDLRKFPESTAIYLHDGLQNGRAPWRERGWQ